jgi:hypothetical protein
MLGTWKDQQVPNVYSHYADFVMETLLNESYAYNETTNKS